MRRGMRAEIETAVAKLKAASDFEIEVTLSAQEADSLLRWILNEQYRR